MQNDILYGKVHYHCVIRTSTSIFKSDPLTLFTWAWALLYFLLPPAVKLGQGNIFGSKCQEFCPQEGGSLGSHSVGRLRGLAWGVSRSTPRGGFKCQGPGPEGVFQHAFRQTTPWQTACSTHPTEMHSCCLYILSNFHLFS